MTGKGCGRAIWGDGNVPNHRTVDYMYVSICQIVRLQFVNFGVCIFYLKKLQKNNNQVKSR